MFKIEAITKGKATHRIELSNLPANASTELALYEARKKLIEMGIKYEEIGVSFTRVGVDILALEMLFLTPTDAAARAIEKGFEAKARDQQRAEN
jgi:hypothetical protein